MRAKFVVESVKDYGFLQEVEMHAVFSGGKPEDNEFASSTPAGRLSLTVTAEGARSFLTPGRAYYLDFSQAAE